MIDWANQMISEVRGVFTAACILVGLIVALMIIAAKPHTTGKSIIGLVVGAFIASVPFLIPWLSSLFEKETNAAAIGAVNQLATTNIAALGNVHQLATMMLF